MRENPPDNLAAHLADAINKINEKRFEREDGTAHLVSTGPTMITVFPDDPKEATDG